MKTAIAVAAAAGFVIFAWLALPKPPQPQSELSAGGHAAHAGDPAERTQGVVLSVDRSAKRVVISHGALPALGMPPMTMEYSVADPELPERLKAGDQVRFHADAAGGAFTASRIEIAN